MKLKSAIHFFESAVSDTTSKSEIKIYGQFLPILHGLNSRAFSEREMLSIEIELDILQLNSKPKNRKRFFKKALNAFESFLSDTYSLTAKGYYSGLGMVYGSSLGMFFGLIFLSSFDRSLGIVIGVCSGMVIGAVIGRSMDAKALAEGRAL